MAAACHYHPDRAGVGVCMRCRRVICAACCTRVDGVNHCHACLKSLGRRTGEERSAAGRAAGALVAMAVLAVTCLAWFGVLWLAQGWLAP
ncbi:MAG TPA: hypothetical protein VFA26_22170 [Gemmataceae bacterium]|nr:hypothetical protein [Gemmataceae bacterium]